MRAFKVLQFNIQFGQKWDDRDPDEAPVDLDGTIAEIRAQDADVIFLQEVEQAQPGGVQKHPPPNFERIRAALPGYDSYFSYPREDPRELPFGIGLAIFSRTPLTDRRRRDLASPPIEFTFLGEKKTPTDRVLIGARTVIGGRILRVYNTHLLAFFMLNADSDDYGDQRQSLIEELKLADGPALMGGDFNIEKVGSLVKQFDRAGFRTVQTERATWRRRPYVLDHLFYNSPLKLVGHAVQETQASDHHMLVARFAFAD